jgi:hypothetical protein
MADHKTDLTADYWQITQEDETPARRFQAACALANYDPDNEHWQDQKFVEFVAGQLVGVLPSELLPWRNALRPVKAHLTAALAVIYRVDKRGEQVRSFATDTLAGYLSDDAEGLFEAGWWSILSLRNSSDQSGRATLATSEKLLGDNAPPTVSVR